MSRIRCSGTKPEAKLYTAVRAVLGHRWRIDQNVNSLPGRPDIVIPSLRLIIFVDGCFYHSCPKHGHRPLSNQEYWGPKLDKNVRRDRTNRRKLRALGYSVLRFWEHDFKATALPSTYNRLQQQLQRRVAKVRSR
jgi:DNA mismatch endonuclease (patch repair protein)